MSTRTSRARLAVSGVITAGLCLAGTATLAAPSHAAPGSCDVAYPVADLTAGQDVTGNTVTTGNDPTSGAFTGNVIGVLKDGIEPGVDMVMAQLTSTQIDKSGIWEGMSGSPVYATDGRLIGAVAYTLSYGSTPVAGITPWEDMHAFPGTTAVPSKIKVGDATARRIANATSVTTAQASQGFSELRAPALVAGLGARALSMATGRPYLNPQVAPAGRAAAGGPVDADMVAGGNLVATESTGDILFGALGTITSVCGDAVSGFGHPMQFAGSTTYGLAGADALYVQSDSLGSSFKVANIGDVIGTVDQDRMTGIFGTLAGDGPPDFPVTSDITYTPTGGTAINRVGTSRIQLPAATAEVTFYELMANHQATLDAYQKGSENQSWTVTGKDGNGTPFTLQAGNRYTDTADITSASVWDLPDMLWLLTHLDGVTVDSVHQTSHINDSTALHKMQGLQQKRGGAWVTVDGTHPALLKAGKNATLRLRYVGGDTGKAFSLPVPAKAAGARGRLFTEESPSYWFERSFPRTLGGLKKLVDTMPRNDQAVFDLYAFGGKSRPVHVHGLTKAESEVITGHGAFKVVIN
ncbi:MAG: hypothetical protein WAV00_19750 [Nocardioides sp.]